MPGTRDAQHGCCRLDETYHLSASKDDIAAKHGPRPGQFERRPMQSTSVQHHPNTVTVTMGSVGLAKRFRQNKHPMSRGGHNWKGSGTVEGSRSLDVMKLARAGYLTGSRLGSWQWSYRDNSTASVSVTGGREAIRFDYRIRTHGEDWQSVSQRIPIRWTSCRFGGERPWFVCDVHANGVYCGRRVTKLYGAGHLFACRHCYRLGYQAQRGGPLDRAHYRLARLQRRLGADYDGPDNPPPPKPKWMRWGTYSRIAQQIEAGQERLEIAFIVGAQGILGRMARSEERRQVRR